jgi:hypothetical protein
MAKRVSDTAAARRDARRLERHADATAPYPASTTVSRPNAPSRMFNVRLGAEQYEALARLAREKHLPMSTMARAWLLDRLDAELRAG